MDISKELKDIVEKKNDIIKLINDEVWDYAELGFQEFKSAKLFEELLEKEGFTVNSGIGGMPTAFEATYGSGKPVIGITAEYDALPVLSQKSEVTEFSPVMKDACGHGCGHNSLGAASFGAAIAVKEYMKKHNIKGTVKLIGCPSEEKGNSKTFLAREGYFDDLDAAFTNHPADNNSIWGMSTLANVSVVFKFKGVTSHAAASPQLGRSALDSVEIMNIGVNYLREHVIPEARMHYAYLDVGGNAPNVVQATASVHYMLRAPKSSQVSEIYERVQNIAKGAALICGTEVEIDFYAGLSDYIPNKSLSKVLHDSMHEIGAPVLDESEYALAKKYYESLSELDKKNTVRLYSSKLGDKIASTIKDKPIISEILPLEIVETAMPGSTDVGDLSYVTPTAMLKMATTAAGTPAHSWQMTGQGKTSYAMKAVNFAAASMALATIKAMENPELLKTAREELNSQTGGKYICPIPEDINPKL